MTYAVILAGGTGSRMGLDIPKQFALLKDKPLIAYTLEAFQNHSEIEAIICVSHPSYMNTIASIAAKYSISKLLKVIEGGSTRQESSYRAIQGYSFSSDDILLIHDAARPFVSAKSISDIIQQTVIHGSANLCTAATDTIIETDGNGRIKRIPERKFLMYVQTPQGFRYPVLRKAHDEALARNEKNATDDISLVLAAGEVPAIVNGTTGNFKITTADDFARAEAVIQNSNGKLWQ